MPITSITIENLKGIGAPANVPLRPVTLLFGANSAGKSTIIQAMQYAWEILENRNPDVDRTRLGGEMIDLGGFRSLVHQHDLTRAIDITLHHTGPLYVDPYLPPDWYFSDTQSEIMGYSISEVADVRDWINVESLWVKLTAKWEQGAGPYVAMYEVGINGSILGQIEADYGTRPELTINARHPFFTSGALDGYGDYGRRLMESILQDFAIPLELTREEALELIKELNIEEAIQSSTPDESSSDPATEPEYVQNFVSSTIPEWGQFLSIKQTGGEKDRSPNQESIFILSQLMLGAGEAVLRDLRGLRYLGPLREIPHRSYVAPLQPHQSRWANGLGAWDCLLRSNDGADRNEALIDRCNHYLNDVLGLGYTIRREHRIQLPEESEILAELRLMATQYDERDAREFQRRILEPLERLPRLAALQLYDENKELDVDPMDIGVGVSQTLPVVVGALEPKCSVYCVEQPELHIHPAVQVGLGDLFLREALGEKRGSRIFLLETHSEHLILRIMRRMRETLEKDLPANFPSVTPENVSVLLVESIEGSTYIREMPLNARGELVKAWPGGFFEEGLRETL